MYYNVTSALGEMVMNGHINTAVTRRYIVVVVVCSHLKTLSCSRADAGFLAGQGLLSHRATWQGSRQACSRTVVVRRTLHTAAVHGHTVSSWPIGSLWTGGWSEATHWAVET